MALNIVLVEPEIPQNTGNIARTCALTGTVLHLVKPLGFSVDDKSLKRAGLDYWNLVKVFYYDNFFQLQDKYPNNDFYYTTTKTENKYSDIKYKDESFFVFGKETKGLSTEILKGNHDKAIRIPMKTDLKRSLNLANAVNIIVFEALRQLEFPGIE